MVTTSPTASYWLSDSPKHGSHGKNLPPPFDGRGSRRGCKIKVVTLSPLTLPSPAMGRGIYLEGTKDYPPPLSPPLPHTLKGTRPQARREMSSLHLFEGERREGSYGPKRRGGVKIKSVFL